MNVYIAVFTVLLLGHVATASTAHWTFDTHLEDVSGNGLDGFTTATNFTSAGTLIFSNETATLPDAPMLRLAPGFAFSCRVKFNRFASTEATWTTLLMKGDYANGEYIVRVNPSSEGRHFGFFINRGTWEPRVNSRRPVETNIWYDIAGGWDGTSLWLSVNNETSRVQRVSMGKPLLHRAYAPVTLGPLSGEIDDLTLTTLHHAQTGVADWKFENTLDNDSGYAHVLAPSKATFIPVTGGFALDASHVGYTTPSTPDLQIAPGVRIDCSVLFREIPTTITTLVAKNNEYMLRLDSKEEGSKLSFFVHLAGWEPRVQTEFSIQTGRWYRISAQWDGSEATLDVNGYRTDVTRTGSTAPGTAPLVIGRFNGLIDNLRIENPKLPLLTLRDFTTENMLLQANRPECMYATLANPGDTPASGTVMLDFANKALLAHSPRLQTLSNLAPHSQTQLTWRIESTCAQTVHATLQLQPEGCVPSRYRHSLAFFGAEEEARTQPLWLPPLAEPATTYYIDSRNGDNTHTGRSENQSWRDFTPINNTLLQPGDALLLRRGSIFNQELIVGARGTSNGWVRIGAYGTGPRPIIRRNGDIADRCVQLLAPEYLHLSSLVVCYAGKGIEACYQGGDSHPGLLFEDIIAHHIEGLYRFNAHGIPEWTDRQGAPGGGHSSAGIYANARGLHDVLIRNCEMFQCSWGFLIGGENIVLDRIFCHDNYVHNTSPHPALTGIYRSYLQNSIFDASGWHAYAGTMGIMLVDPVGLIVRNCHFLNMPDSGSHDSGGIDFEAHGQGCRVDQCTFRNNAGAAIEVLGLQSPQPRNVEITRSRFIQNNVANKLGPSEIFIWGRSKDPNVCCSSGLIHKNGYVLNAGVAFFTNEAPTLTQWTLRENQAYTTATELDRAMPLNNPPNVDAGPEQWIDQPTFTLKGLVRDDRRTKSRLKIAWEVLEGPGHVIFKTPEEAETEATFDQPGDYLLRLVADDGQLWRSSMTTVHLLPAQTAVINAYDFSQPLNKQGWSAHNLGTHDKTWSSPIKHRGCISRPVDMVGGGYYIVAVENTTNAYLISANDLNIDFSAFNQIVLCFQNHTPAKKLLLRWTTAHDTNWETCPRATLDIHPLSTVPTRYVVPMPTPMIDHKRLKQVRLDLTDGTANSGTFRIDYIYFAKSSR